MRSVYDFAVEVYYRFIQHNGFLVSAGIAFFAFLAIFPMLLLVGIILSYIFENQQYQQEFLAYVFSRIPSLTDTVQNTIEGLIQERKGAGLIAFFGLIWAATGLVSSLSVVLNTVYGVKETRNIVKLRIVSLAVLLIVFTLLVISFGATVIVSVLRTADLVTILPPELTSLVWIALSYIVGFVSTLLLFYIIYRFVPNIKLSLRDIWLGILLVSIAWEIEKYALSIYFTVIGNQSYSLIYGSLASIIITMFWINISSMLFMLGAEINMLYKERQLV